MPHPNHIDTPTGRCSCCRWVADTDGQPVVFRPCADHRPPLPIPGRMADFERLFDA